MNKQLENRLMDVDTSLTTLICACLTSYYIFSLIFAVIITSIPLGRLSARFWIMAVGVRPFFHKRISEVSY